MVDREFSLLKMLLFCTDRHYLHYFTLPLTLFLLHRGKVRPWLHPLYDEDAADVGEAHVEEIAADRAEAKVGERRHRELGQVAAKGEHAGAVRRAVVGLATSATIRPRVDRPGT